MRNLKKGQHVFIAFQNGEAILDSQLRPRMYTSLANAERNTPPICKGKIEYVEYAPTITTPTEWVSVEKRLPEFPGFLDHIMVVTCDKNGYVMPMVRERTLVGYEWMERWLFPWHEIYVGPEITHWMPLPESPKEDK